MQPGIYILRHPQRGLPPLSVARAPGGLGRVEAISTPATQGAILRDGADCIVLHVIDAPVELLVTAFLEHAGAEVPSIKIDRVGLDTAPAPRTGVAPAKAGKQIEISGKGLSIIGHIERTGDVVASEGHPLGKAESNLRLEGFQVMWPDRPEGVDLAYSIVVEGGGATQIVKTGQFCGTRGEARRITEVTFSLMGPRAEQYQLDGTAFFSGGFKVPVTSGMALGGPSGLEHLTSIGLRVIPNLQPKKKAKNPWDESPQTQIFKTKKKSAPQKAKQNKVGEVKLANKKVA